jgi:gamma-glutamyltranspeptidase/glutathione hydrolase
LENPIKDYNNYQKEIDLKISKAYAKEIFSKAKMKKDGKPLGEIKDNGETTHFSVLDSSGMGVSVTCSLSGYFGSFTSTKDLGFFYNSYLKSLLGFGLGKSLQPNTKVPTSMSPSLVRKNGQNVLLIGTPGSKRIVSTIAQVIQLWVDSSMSITDIIKLPRLHAIRNLAYLENSNLTSTELNSIRDRGFKIAFPHYLLTKNGLNAWFGGVHAIGFKNGKWSLADDPRRDSRK